MKALEAAVRGIVKDGLVWGASKLVPVGFGIKKLQINLIIEDDKISLAELEEEIAEIEEYVQSTDIVSLSFHASIEQNADRFSGRYAKAIECNHDLDHVLSHTSLASLILMFTLSAVNRSYLHA